MVSISSIVRTVAFFSALAASHAAAADDNSPQRTATIAREEARDWSVNATTRESVEQTLTAAGAAFMTVHFSEFNLAEGDVVTIRNSTGDVLDEYKGLGRGDLGKQGGFYSTVVYGDKVTVQFKPAADAKVESDSGFKIDKITRSTNQAKVSSICSADNTLPAKCYENAPNIPEAYKKAQAVARLIVNGAEACTGWLIGSEGHLLTNQHCIGTQSAASNLQVQFEAESPTCDDQCRASGSCKGVIAATTSTLVAVNADLDYALVKLDPLVDLSKYGYLKLRVAGAIENEEIYIPEHPGGKAKRMAVIVDSGEAARVHVDRSTECGEHRLEYDADTEGGASGSPIIAVSDNLVIGLHSCGNTQEVCMNSALDIRSLVHELRALNVVPADALDDPAAELPEGPWIPGATEAPAATTPAPVLDICPGFNFQNSCEEFTGGKCVWNDGSCSKNPAFTSVPAPETPAPETPAPETPAPETPAPETPAPETPAPETPAPETPAPETPAPETPAPETPAPETPAPETPVPETEAPVQETEAPAAEADTPTPADQGTVGPDWSVPEGSPVAPTMAPESPEPKSPEPPSQIPEPTYQSPAPVTRFPPGSAPAATPTPSRKPPSSIVDKACKPFSDWFCWGFCKWDSDKNLCVGK